MRRNGLTTKFVKLALPIRLVGVSDSAFRKEDSEGLAMRGYIIGFMSCVGGDALGGCLVPLEYLSRKQRHVVRSTFAAELFSLVDMLDHMLLIADGLSRTITDLLRY